MIDMIEFRKGTFMDINELVRMRLAYIADDRGEIDKNVMKQIQDSLPECFEKHLNKDLFAYITCDNNRIISTVLLYITEKPANLNNIHSKMGEVLNVFTDSEYRRQGIAEKLMKMMLQDAKEMKLSAVKLEATDMGKDLYLKIGFKTTTSRYIPMRYEL